MSIEDDFFNEQISAAITRGELAIRAAYPDWTPEEMDRTYIDDTIADLLIFAEANGFSLDDMIECARVHADAEVAYLPARRNTIDL
jgi:hypothetical protein